MIIKKEPHTEFIRLQFLDLLAIASKISIVEGSRKTIDINTINRYRKIQDAKVRSSLFLRYDSYFLASIFRNNLSRCIKVSRTNSHRIARQTRDPPQFKK